MKSFLTILLVFLTGYLLGSALWLSFLADKANVAIVVVVFVAGIAVGAAAVMITNSHPVTEPLTAHDTDETGGEF
jgi:hypothetical protein